MTRGDKNYYVTFIDDYSRYAKVYLLEIKMKPIKEVSMFCLIIIVKINELIHEITPPNSLESNGIAKKM